MTYEQPPGAEVTPAPDVAAPVHVPYDGVSSSYAQPRPPAQPAPVTWARTVDRRALNRSVRTLRRVATAVFFLPIIGGAIYGAVSNGHQRQPFTLPTPAPHHPPGVAGIDPVAVRPGQVFTLPPLTYLPGWRVGPGPTGLATVTSLRASNPGTTPVTTALQLTVTGTTTAAKVTCAAPAIPPRSAAPLSCVGVDPLPADVVRVDVVSLI